MKNKHLLIGVGDLVDKLSIANAKIGRLETRARDENISNEERGKLTLQIRQINDNDRVVARNALNILFGKDYWEEKDK
jgi:hypothetical protein